MTKNSTTFSNGRFYSPRTLTALTEFLDYNILSFFSDNDRRRLIIWKIQIQNSYLVFANYYAPNDENSQIKVLNEISNHLDTIISNQSTEFVWGGDFNVLFHTTILYST